ncbi:putative malate dehydrogenase [Helianthus annuus]|nr:putative malate dehydrogenase [Helianthus annuus]
MLVFTFVFSGMLLVISIHVRIKLLLCGTHGCFYVKATPQSNNLLDETIVATKRTQDGGTEVVEATTGKGSATFSKASFLNYILNKLGWVTCNHV